MEDIKNELKQSLKKYRDIDDQLRQLNKLVYDLREKRKISEYEITDILKDHQFSQVNMLRLENDNSTIKIQRPGTYSKPWSLSAQDLKNYLDHYFENAGRNANKQDCFDFIVTHKKQDSIVHDFKLTRIIPNENLENE